MIPGKFTATDKGSDRQADAWSMLIMVKHEASFYSCLPVKVAQ